MPTKPHTRHYRMPTPVLVRSSHGRWHDGVAIGEDYELEDGTYHHMVRVFTADSAGAFWVPGEDVKRAEARRNGSVDRETMWRRRQIILPSELRHHLEDWHGGQTSATYALASSSYRHLVSLSMIDMAVQELERVLGRESKGRPHGLTGRTGLDKHDRKALSNVIDELAAVRLYWREHSAKEAGLQDHDEGYDTRDYGMTAHDESEIPTRSG